MRLLADEHIPPAIVSALRGEGHDIAVVGDDIDLGAEDTVLLEYARDTDRLILSEDTDFRGADPDLDVEDQPGFLRVRRLPHREKSLRQSVESRRSLTTSRGPFCTCRVTGCENSIVLYEEGKNVFFPPLVKTTNELIFDFTSIVSIVLATLKNTPRLRFGIKYESVHCSLREN